MALFRKKPVVIEAVQWDGTHATRLILRDFITQRVDERGERVAIETLEGWMTADKGDWIIRGVKGEFYPCKPDIFAATYEAVK